MHASLVKIIECYEIKSGSLIIDDPDIERSKLAISVGFRFYEPGPAVSKCRKEDSRLRKNGVLKTYSPPKPAQNSDCPTKYRWP